MDWISLDLNVQLLLLTYYNYMYNSISIIIYAHAVKRDNSLHGSLLNLSELFLL